MKTFLASFIAILWGINVPLTAQPNVLDPQLDMEVYASLPSQGERPVCLSRLPNGNLVYSNLDGDIFEIVEGNAQLLFDADDHLLPYVSHMEAMGDYMYICGSVIEPNGYEMIGYVMEGQISTKSWRILAKSDPYYLGRSFNDHRFSSLLVSPNREFVYVHSGTRTNSGEVHQLDDVPETIGLRDQPLRGKLFKLPTNQNTTLQLSNDSTELYASGFVHSEGLRHLFAMAWGTDGNFYGGSNSDRRDVAEAFYKITAGAHYGFPWWIGGGQNPIQFGDYNPNVDRLLPSGANNQGYYDNDPNFPPMPGNIQFVQPYKNIGPDADKFRSPNTGLIGDASENGQAITTFSPHRSPVGLIFDTQNTLPLPFQGDGFMVSYTNNSKLLQDDGHDLLHLTLLGNDNLSARKLVDGFIHPMDVMVIGDKLYLLEMGNRNGSERKIYEITVSSTTHVQAGQSSSKRVNFYPNPAQESLRIEYLSPTPVATIRLTDQNGKQVSFFERAMYEIPVSDLPPQVYFIEVVFTDGNRFIHKFLKQ